MTRTEFRRGSDVKERILDAILSSRVKSNTLSNRQQINTNTETVVLITPTIVTSQTKTIDDKSIDKIQRLELDQDSEIEKLDKEMDVFFGGTPAGSTNLR